MATTHDFVVKKGRSVLNFTQLVLPVHDVVDDEFRSKFPDLRVHKCWSADDLAKVMPETDILFVNNQSFTPAVGEIVNRDRKRLKWIQFATVGIDTAKASGLPTDVLLSNVRGLRTGILAGHAIALMLGVMRGFRQYEKFRERREWGRMEMFPHILTPEGGTMVILGLGEIGQDIAKKAKGFSMHVIGVSRGAKAEGPIDEVVPRERLHEVLPRADVLMIAMPLDDTTRHYIGARELALLKSTAVVVNISRGGVADEKALIAALKQKKFAGLGSDVTEIEPLPADSELWDMENVLFTPHLAGRGGEAQKLYLAQILATNLTRFQKGERLYNEIAADGSILPDNVSL
jgi:phosphoglycerate dehydrogenase-like enzyme